MALEYNHQLTSSLFVALEYNHQLTTSLFVALEYNHQLTTSLLVALEYNYQLTTSLLVALQYNHQLTRVYLWLWNTTINSPQVYLWLFIIIVFAIFILLFFSSKNTFQIIGILIHNKLQFGIRICSIELSRRKFYIFILPCLQQNLQMQIHMERLLSPE